MKVDVITSIDLSSNIAIDNTINSSATGLAASIHAPDKLNWIKETDKMMVDNTFTSTILPTSSSTLKEKISVAISSRDVNDNNTNHTVSF